MTTQVSPSNTHWDKLLAWLKTKGMDVSQECLPVECRTRPGAGNGLFATRSCPPAATIFSVPAEALINVKTLGPHYASGRHAPSLTATQMISLHLFLHRPIDGDSMDPLFGPYISILPRNFDSHPLTWLISRDRLQHNKSIPAMLLEMLPPSVSGALNVIYQKFWDDWTTIRDYIVACSNVLNRSTVKPGLSLPCVKADDPTVLVNFLWAWLNVNTRCIYHRINASQNDPDNLTLCPILDIANHTKTSPQVLPATPNAESWNMNSRSTVERGVTLVSSCDSAIKAGEELCLTYGAHANRTLFVEYGFVNTPHCSAEVDVQDIVESLIAGKGDLGIRMRQILTTEGYWGDWTLHSDPKPAHPSFRLITALRLYDLCPPLLSDEILQLWRDTLMGNRYIVSKENEIKWRVTLVHICEMTVQRAATHMHDLKILQDCNAQNEGWIDSAYENIASLWKEEECVAEAVLESIRSGEDF